MKTNSKYIGVLNLITVTCLLLISSQTGMARQNCEMDPALHVGFIKYHDSQKNIKGEDPLVIWNKLSSDKQWQVLVRQLNAQKFGKLADKEHSFCYSGEYISDGGVAGDFELFVFDFSKTKGRNMEIASLIYTRVDECIYRGYVIFPDDALTALNGDKKRVEKSVDRHMKMVNSSGWFEELQKQLAADSEACVRSIKVCMKRAKPEKTEFGLAEILKQYWVCENPSIAEICHQNAIANSAARTAATYCKD